MKNRNELYMAIPILNSGLTDEEIRSFSVKHEEGLGLVKYLCGFAEAEERNDTMRTYIVRDNETNNLVAYFSLKAGMISTNEQLIENRLSFDTRPGIELANFAVNYSFIRKYENFKGVGSVIFDLLIVPIISKVAEKVGVKYIYIFSLPFEPLIQRYEEYGFKRLPKEQEEQLHSRKKPNYDRNCIFMYQVLQSKQTEQEETVE